MHCNRQIIPAYLIGGVLAMTFYMFGPYLHIFPASPQGFALGASGAIMGIAATAAILIPNREFNLWVIKRAKLKYVVLVILGLELYSFFFGPNPVSHIITLAGALGGFLFGIFAKTKKPVTPDDKTR